MVSSCQEDHARHAESQDNQDIERRYNNSPFAHVGLAVFFYRLAAQWGSAVVSQGT